MNHEPDLPAARDTDSGRAEESSRLAEIERRLKAARPRPPSLDPLALLRIASGGEVESVSWRRSDGSESFRVVRPTRANGFWTALAGSWICGVAVGVLVTLMLASRPALIVDSADSVVRQDVWAPAPAEESEPVEGTVLPEGDEEIEEIEEDPPPVVPAPSPQRRMLNDTLMAIIADPRAGRHLDARIDGSVLRAGMLYRPGAGELWDSAREAWDMDKPKLDRTNLGQPTAMPTIDVEPPAPITRGQLMEQLMSEAARHGVL